MCSMANGKRYDNAVKAFDREATFAPNEAVAMSKQFATAKFDETIELVCRLGVDPRKAEEMVRGTVALPSGTGRNVRVAVFAQGEAALQAKEAGAEPLPQACLGPGDAKTLGVPHHGTHRL